MFLFNYDNKNKKSSANNSRGQEIPVVPPQFTPCGASWDPDRSAGCIGPYPSLPTLRGFPQSRSERYSTRLLPLPCTIRQLSGEAECVCTMFLQRVLGDEISSSVPPGFAEVNKNFVFLLTFCPKTVTCFCIQIHTRRKNVRLSRKILRFFLLLLAICAPGWYA